MIHNPHHIYEIHISGTMTRKKLLMDVDCGVDDAQAIMLVLAAPNVDLLAITCSHGNTSVDNVCRNTLRVLQACNRLDVGATLTVSILSGLLNSLSVAAFTGENSTCCSRWNPRRICRHVMSHVAVF